ncbi:hypothetical protein CDD83_7625 [Cordyceps sp. RAO-2017]|nr:hypothetical protein CDD83_7625 [Cordyceps sp. RAO-2017]
MVDPKACGGNVLETAIRGSDGRWYREKRHKEEETKADNFERLTKLSEQNGLDWLAALHRPLCSPDSHGHTGRGERVGNAQPPCRDNEREAGVGGPLERPWFAPAWIVCGIVVVSDCCKLGLDSKGGSVPSLPRRRGRRGRQARSG